MDNLYSGITGNNYVPGATGQGSSSLNVTGGYGPSSLNATGARPGINGSSGLNGTHKNYSYLVNFKKGPKIKKALQQAELSLPDIDLLEINEAFAAQTLAVEKELQWDRNKVNVNGGAIALGHPVGASGARITVSLLHEMQRQKVDLGLASLCIGGGMGISLIVERT